MNADKTKNVISSVFSGVHLWFILFVFLVSTSDAQEVRGVSLAHLHRRGLGYGSDDCRQQLEKIKSVGANWVAINDFAHMPDVNGPNVQFGGDRTMQREDLVQVIRDAHAIGLKVLVKPHIWAEQFWDESKWHGDIRMNTEEDWDAWFAQYTSYVLFNASIAEETGAEALCVGVEYEGTTDQEARWRKLIAEVRQVYSGKLTYAATFLEWKIIRWWDALDCVGIDAYFPVAQNLLADEAELREHWKRVYDELEPLARSLGKPICFTEIGYSDSNKAGKEPWSYEIIEPNSEYQARLYRVAIEEASRRDFMAGVFIWKWFTSDQFRNKPRRDPFAMQDREPVLRVLRDLWQP